MLGMRNKVFRRAGVARASLVAAIALPAVLVAAQAASAASWTQQFTPGPTGATSWQFNGVSCQSDSECMAVGSYTDQSFDNHVLTEQRQGSSWAVVSGVEPEGATSSELNAISCPTATNCTAVGDYVNGSNEVPLAEHWDGSGYWALDSTPVPPGAATSELTAVSCPSANACIAVGTYSDSTDGSGEQLFAATLHGFDWTLLTPSVPAGAVQSELNGISCLSATDCVAVGDYSEGTGTSTLAETWNGSSWTIQSTPNYSAYSGLSGVSCTSATACTAVGPGAMAVRWNGTTWSQQTFAKPQQGTIPDLFKVSCTSATTCTAVGQHYIQGVGNTAAEIWNGTSWKFEQVNVGSSYDTAYLADVSCSYPATCTAVGTYHDPVDGNRALVETVAVQWQIQTTPVPSGAVGDSIQDVSCTSANACMAVASYVGENPGLMDFTELWNGDSWTTGSIPNPTVADLRAVSCTAAKACTAVGSDTADNQVEPLAERWNGTSWTVQSVPNPSGKTDGQLTGVSCASATACVAVGTASDSSNNAETIADIWNGTSWTVKTIPAQAGSGIHSVSCASATACTAVGAGLAGTLAASWNGTKWTIQSTDDPAGSTGATLNGVSCMSASDCLAVGSYNDGSTEVTLSEFWNGTSWTLHSTPPLSAAKSSELVSVSCTAVGPCTAVGELTKSGHNHPTLLAEQWSGTKWGVQNTVTPPGSKGSELTGVSCLSGIDCTAVGYYSNSQHYLTAVAEQYS
jgi:hypothetical protein